MQKGLAVKGIRIALISIATLLFCLLQKQILHPRGTSLQFLLLQFCRASSYSENCGFVKSLSTLAFSITLASIGLGQHQGRSESSSESPNSRLWRMVCLADDIHVNSGVETMRVLIFFKIVVISLFFASLSLILN